MLIKRYKLCQVFHSTCKYLKLVFVVHQELQPVVGDLRYAVLHSMLFTVTKNPQNVQKALKNFVEILNVDVSFCVI